MANKEDISRIFDVQVKKVSENLKNNFETNSVNYIGASTKSAREVFVSEDY